MLNIKNFFIGIGCLFLSSAFPTLVMAMQGDKESTTPVLLECETKTFSITKKCPSCIETLHFFRGNNVFGFDHYDSKNARQDAENVCQRENCEISSCTQVRGEISGNFILKCHWGYIANNTYENIRNKGQKKKIRFGSFNITSIVGTTKEILQRELDESNITYPPLVSDCIIGNLDVRNSNWQWLNE